MLLKPSNTLLDYGRNALSCLYGALSTSLMPALSSTNDCEFKNLVGWFPFQGHATEPLLCAVIVLYCITFHQVSFPQNDGFINTAHYVDLTVLSCSGLVQNSVSVPPHRQIVPKHADRALVWLLEYLPIHIWGFFFSVSVYIQQLVLSQSTEMMQPRCYPQFWHRSDDYQNRALSLTWKHFHYLLQKQHS